MNLLQPTLNSLVDWFIYSVDGWDEGEGPIGI